MADFLHANSVSDAKLEGATGDLGLFCDTVLSPSSM